MDPSTTFIAALVILGLSIWAMVGAIYGRRKNKILTGEPPEGTSEAKRKMMLRVQTWSLAGFAFFGEIIALILLLQSVSQTLSPGS